MPAKLPQVERDRMFELFDEGLSGREIAALTGRSVGLVSKERKRWSLGDAAPHSNASPSGSRRTKVRVDRASREFGPPLGVGDLGPEARAAHDDIEFFALRYFGITLQPWQKDAAERVVGLLSSPWDEYAVVNVAPGSGKSTFFTLILPAWLTVRDRAIRGLIGSATMTQARWYVDQLRKEFMRTSPISAGARGERAGLVDAEATLGGDFGRFRPDIEGVIWTKSEFEVAQLGDEYSTAKESTWSAYGKDASFIGARVDFVIWDDVWSTKSTRTSDSREEFYKWWDDYAETRLEPGGLLLLQGQRLSPADVYAHALGKSSGAEEDGEPDREGAPEGGRKYHHIVYPAYFEDLDPDPLSDEGVRLKGLDAPAWPEGPLLSPRRLSWRKLRAIRANDPDQFELVYQQRDTDLKSKLINPLWLEGGTDPSGEVFRGCYDSDRRLWEVPVGLKPPLVSVAMVDPSVTNMWGWLWYLWQPGEGDDPGTRWVVGIHNGRMQAPDALDWNARAGEFHGLMEDWQQLSVRLGVPIQAWVIEKNAAHAHFLQYEHVSRWMSKHRTRIIGHLTTGQAKADPELGLQMLGSVVRHGRLRIPRQGAGQNFRNMGPEVMLEQKQVSFLRDQLLEFPDGRRDDLVMAAWFFEAKSRQLRPSQADAPRAKRPGWTKMLKGAA